MKVKTKMASRAVKMNWKLGQKNCRQVVLLILLQCHPNLRMGGIRKSKSGVDGVFGLLKTKRVNESAQYFFRMIY